MTINKSQILTKKTLAIVISFSFIALLFQNCGGDLESGYNNLQSNSLNDDFDPNIFTGDNVPDVPSPGSMPPSTPYEPPATSPQTQLEQKIVNLFNQHVLPHNPDMNIANHQIKFWTHHYDSLNLTDFDLESGIKIEGYYVKHLKRIADVRGLKYWLNDYLEKKETLSNIENNIATSVESKVVKMYLAKDNRTPDAPGRLYWMDSISKNNSSFEDLAYLLDNPHITLQQTLNDSNISKSDFNMNSQTAAIIKNMYDLHSELSPANSRIAFWQYQLNHGSSVNLLEDGVKIDGYYAKYLKRRADLEGLNYWYKELRSGKLNLSQIEEIIKNSIDAKIVQAYMTYDNRVPDPKGRIYWRQQIQNNPDSLNDLIHMLKNPEVLY